MKVILFAVILLASDLYGQSQMTKRDLKGEWFVNNLDSIFFEADTLILFKHTNREKIDWIKGMERRFVEPVTELLGSAEYVNIEFKSGKRISFCIKHMGGYYNECWILPIKWTLKSDTIRISSNKFNWKFKIISKGRAEFNQLISNNPDKYETLNTPTLTITRIK